MPKNNTTTARLLVRYGKYTEGETIRGRLAEEMIAKDMAKDITPKAKKAKPAKGKKNMGAAPENKSEDDLEV